jgi:Domain of unknown function (DUF4340)
MRGARSLIILLVIAGAFGAYLYFVEAKRDPLDTGEKRDKVFTVEADKIEEITIKSESGDRTTLKKDGGAWQIAAPAGATADPTEASGISTNLSTLEQQRVVEENPTDLKDFGLAEPRIEVSFKEGGKEQTLQIGSKTPTGNDLYAKVAGQPKVFLIAAYLESTFNRSTFDLRDKTALKVDAQKVDSLEVTTDSGVKKFTRVNSAWQLTSPAEPRSDAVGIDNVVSRVLNAQMKALAPAKAATEYGFDKPAATVRVGTGSSQATLLIGKPAEEGSVYAKDEARAEVFTIESGILDDLKKAPSEFRQKDLFDARTFNTTKVELVRGTGAWTFEKVKEKGKDGAELEKWVQRTPVAKDADVDKINTLLTALTGARADAFVDKAPSAKPEAIFMLTHEAGKTERVSFARSGSDGFAMREGMPGAAKIPVSLVDDVVKAVEALK